MPVSGSTSTSQNCVEKPGAWPPAFTDAAAVIGPPVAADFAASAFSDSGSKSPTLAAGRLGEPVLPDHALRVHVPDQRRPLAQVLDHRLGGVHHRDAGGEGHARTAGHVRVADRPGIGDDRPHLPVVHAQRLGRHDRHRRARAADVRAAGRHQHGAVGVHLDGGARIRRRR